MRIYSGWILKSLILGLGLVIFGGCQSSGDTPPSTEQMVRAQWAKPVVGGNNSTCSQGHPNCTTCPPANAGPTRAPTAPSPQANCASPTGGGNYMQNYGDFAWYAPTDGACLVTKAGSYVGQRWCRTSECPPGWVPVVVPASCNNPETILSPGVQNNLGRGVQMSGPTVVPDNTPIPGQNGAPLNQINPYPQIQVTQNQMTQMTMDGVDMNCQSCIQKWLAAHPPAATSP